MAVDITLSPGSAVQYRSDEERSLAQGLTCDLLDFEKLSKAQPDRLIALVRASDPDTFIPWAEEYLEKKLGRRVAIFDASIESLAELYSVIEGLGSIVGRGAETRRLTGRIKAQLMEWADSFFDRSRGRKVAVLSSVSPLRAAELWFSDFVKLFSGQLFVRDSKRLNVPLSWEEVVAFRPEVIVVAPEGEVVTESVKTLATLQGLAHWEDLPAVKRGDVVFADGASLYNPGPSFLKGAAVLVSAMASLESGYITKRDEYVKLRFVELHRHKFL